MAKKLKIGFVSLFKPNPDNVYYYMLTSLQQLSPTTDLLESRLGNLLRRILSQKIPFSLKKMMYSLCARYINVQARRYDILVVPFGSSLIRFMNTKKPLMYISDATFDQIKDSYFSFMTKKEKRFYELAERTALKKAIKIYYSSSWPVDSAITHYGCDKKKIVVIPFGANYLHKIPYFKKSLSFPVHITLIGRDFKRKGFDLVDEIHDILNKKKIDHKITVIGDKKVSNSVGFLRKSDRKEYEKFCHIMKQSHILLVPSLHDCTPHVINEAFAYGAVVIGNNVGGIPEMLEKSGILVKDNSVEAYVEEIAYLIRDTQRYEQLSRSSYKEYNEKRNWNTWGRKIIEEIKKI